ncbi:MAG: hypothetical protein HW389_3488 [Bacteroidetes bacterium]|nr:hypothetical protein [Bacteroidota bacterium]MBM2840962.1 hypothetical protein [Bacteroidota bacterium]
MRRDGSGFPSFAKRLFVGGLLGAAVALLYAPRSRTGLRSDIPQEGVRFQRRYRPLSTARVEEIIETRKLVRPTIGWLMIFVAASAVSMIADLKMNRK